MGVEVREECVCESVYAHTCVSGFVSFSLLGSYAKFVPDTIFVFLCYSKNPKELNLLGIFHLVLQPKSI